MGKAKYRYVGVHAEVLPSGQPVEPGEFVHLSDKDVEEDHVLQSMLADGRLAGTGSKSEEEQEKAERKVARREEG